MILSNASNGVASRYWFYLHLEQHWFYIFINETVGEIFLTSTCIKLSSAHKNSQFKKKKGKIHTGILRVDYSSDSFFLQLTCKFYVSFSFIYVIPQRALQIGADG